MLQVTVNHSQALLLDSAKAPVNVNQDITTDDAVSRDAALGIGALEEIGELRDSDEVEVLGSEIAVTVALADGVSPLAGDELGTAIETPVVLDSNICRDYYDIFGALVPSLHPL
jgi:hypothetical protein